MEFLNRLFGIENNVSAPILISLIVFIIGGLIRLIIKTILDYFSRLLCRNSFRNILLEIIKTVKIKSNHTENFYLQLNIEHNSDWLLKYTRITYLELAFQQNFNSIFNSFRVLSLFRCSKKLRNKAFNRVWAILENLKFYENRILTDLEKFIQMFTKHETEFYSQLEKLREQNDKLYQPYVGKDLSKVGFPENVTNYLINRDKVFNSWQTLDESSRRFVNILHDKLVKPLHELNLKNQEIELTVEQNTILLAAIYEYRQMTKILSVNNQIFYNYFRNYKSTYKMLEKCMTLLK